MKIHKDMRRKILVIDTYNSVRKLVRIILQKEGYDVIEAVSSREALTILSQFEIALIITDLSLPGMDGIELARVLESRRMQSRPPILLLSSRLDTAVQKKARAVGMEAWLSKPFESQDLTQMVSNLIGETDPQSLQGKKSYG